MQDLHEILNNSGIGVCVVNNEGLVTYQNAAVATACADVCGKECNEKNHLLCRYVDAFTEGTVRIPIQMIHGKYYDILGVVLKDQRMIYLIPIQNDKVEIVRELETSSLTAKEKEVAALMIADFSRENIARVLNVSENTIKTHIKNIYTKIPARVNEFIRGKTPATKL